MNRRFNQKRVQKLPILKYKSKIRDLLSRNQVLLISGETGCGKSTQLPKFLHEFGYTKTGVVVCLHPRCIAAITLAERVSEELHSNVGNLVGYLVRFDSRTSRETKIIFMTNGFMIMSIMCDIAKKINWTDKYSVVIIDEAHERSIHTDIMLGLVKLYLNANKSVKFIIMSATMKVSEFSNYFPKCGYIEVTEKMNKVDVIYRPLASQNYIAEIKKVVIEILRISDKGDILIFLHTERKVRDCKKLLKDLKKVVVFKLFASMDYESKKKVFQTFKDLRKIIVATNIAEISLTIPGVDFVIDSGAVKRVLFDNATLLENWVTQYVSVAEAEQRKGRTGRTSFGKCYRLYEERFLNPTTDPDYDSNITFPHYVNQKMKTLNENKYFIWFPLPEIRQGNLGQLILTLKSMKINDILKFPFIEHPEEDQYNQVVEHLKHLCLLSYNEQLTQLGREVSMLPVDPRLGKVAIIGSNIGVRGDIIIMVAMCSVRHVMKTNMAKGIGNFFFNEHGDIFRYLDIYKNGKQCNFERQWCKRFKINQSCIVYVENVVNELNRFVKRPFCPYYNRDVSICLIKSAFLSAFFQNIAVPRDRYHYALIKKDVKIHESSCLVNSGDMVMFLVVSSVPGDTIINGCTTIDIELMSRMKPTTFHIKEHIWTHIIKEIS